MRIVLLYPPPWKIPAAGEAPDTTGDGPPTGAGGAALDNDFYMAPYGLLSLAAQARRAGKHVEILNLSNFPWPEVEATIDPLDADLFGLSCYTSNRRGVALVADCIRRRHPDAHVVIGGPHATALPREMLTHHRAIDTVVLGEGEETFLELIARLEAGRPTAGIAGTAWRASGGVEVGPPRERIADLDALASPHEYFTTPLLLTSRGCPGQCTFCASNTMWGRQLCFHSSEYVLDSLAAALAKLPHRLILIKDDTFTANRRRAMRICQGIVDRKLNFLWSCDTRADALSEELLHAMRRAGCQRLSLGVESGSPEILANIKKRITPEQVVEATRMAGKFGFQVRFYMMVGNRGETRATFQSGLDLIRRANPDDFCYSLLSFYPGTEEYEIIERKGKVTAEIFFRGDFKHLAAFADTSPAESREIMQWFAKHPGVQNYSNKTVAQCRAALELLGDLHAAHMDLGGACVRENMPDEAERHVRRALEMDYPLPGIGYNYLACIAGIRGDVEAIKDNLMRARRIHPHHEIVANIASVDAWLTADGPAKGLPLRLIASQEFELTIQAGQPIMPGPLDGGAGDGPTVEN